MVQIELVAKDDQWHDQMAVRHSEIQVASWGSGGGGRGWVGWNSSPRKPEEDGDLVCQIFPQWRASWTLTSIVCPEWQFIIALTWGWGAWEKVDCRITWLVRLEAACVGLTENLQKTVVGFWDMDYIREVGALQVAQLDSWTFIPQNLQTAQWLSEVLKVFSRNLKEFPG